MSDDTDYNADTLRRLADRMDTLQAWLPDGVTVTLTSGGVDSLVVKLVDGDEHYGSIDPGVLVGVESTNGPLKEPNPTPDVTPLVERVQEELFARNEPLSDEVAIQIAIPGTALIALANLYVKTNGDVVTYRRVDVHKFQIKYLHAAAWAKDMEAADLETERRVPEIGEWYKRGGFLFLRVSENSCFDPVCGDIIEGLDFLGSSALHAVTDDMTPYLFGEEDRDATM